jgi:membrane-anchored protein YejM (alkaline phosphatase superfamily)
MSNSNLNPPPDLDPDQLTRLLDLELAHKRTEWKRTHDRARKARINAIMLLFMLMVGAAMAFMYLFSSVNEERPVRSQTSNSTQSHR